MAATSPQAEYTHEVRFAVVMYGGVSLAIYINGIAQELLRLVRSTGQAGKLKDGTRVCLTGSSTDPDNQLALKPTERVYRQLSYILANKSLHEECRRLSQEEENVPAPRLTQKLEALSADDTRPINLKFVVDILSGTSAGGINAIYLAKALANDQSIEELKQLWINEGDIGLLINDRKSVAGLKLAKQNPPQSLLNSRRMYLKLLKSLDDMESGSINGDSPYVDEIDLFITTTDIAGMPLPIRLSDTVVFERRHRNVFHFKYVSNDVAPDEYRNDFAAANNPFLAYAARCTSSFPFAFEPMRLADIDEVLDTFNDYRKLDKTEMKKQWQRFFKEKVGSTGSVTDFTERSFGDGGYLDNKPFTYATETLSRRYSPLPVDRKLIYIEPSPEHPEDSPVNLTKPDALANVKAALLDLPAYETIREDLQRLIQRNNLINRINRITSAVDHDLDQPGVTNSRPKLQSGEWETLDLAGMVNNFGIYYLPYRRLRIAAVTDALAYLVARILELEEDSAQFFAVRVLIRAWREKAYPDYHRSKPTPTESATTGPAKEKTKDELLEEEEATYTANQLLIHYDFAYWLRRMNFIRRKVDWLYKLKDFQPPETRKESEDDTPLSEEERIINRLKKTSDDQFDYLALSEEQKVLMHQRLMHVRAELREAYKELRSAGRQIQARYKKGNDNTIAAKIKAIPLGIEQIRGLLGLPPKPAGTELDFSKLDEDQCLERAKELFKKPEFDSKFKAAARALRLEMLEKVVNPTYGKGKALFRPAVEEQATPGGPPSEPLNETERNWNVIKKYLWRYFSQFDDFDQIGFPILYGVEEGESDLVEVIRISPEDATTLINERQEKRNSADGIGRRKLAGVALHHFGAFLDRTWRQNDIMWGRLDGAERLITALLPEPADRLLRAEMIRQAQTAILVEEMPPKHRQELRSVMTDALIRASAGEPIETAIEKTLSDLDAGSSVRKRLESILYNSLDDKELLRFMSTGYEVNRKIDAKMMLRAVSRSTQVIGQVFENIANQNSLDGKSLAWIARLGQVFWGLVEVAVPGSMLNLLMMHWLKVLYVFELLLLILSFLFSASSVQTYALKIFAITVVINLAVLLLRDKMRGKQKWQYAAAGTAIGLVLLFAVIGVADLFGFGLSNRILGWLSPVKTLAQTVRGWLKPVSEAIARIL